MKVMKQVFVLFPCVFTIFSGEVLAQKAIIGGIAGLPTDFVTQYTVAVESPTTTPREYCTGALIAPNIVLTAAHCVTENLQPSQPYSPNLIKIRLGITPDDARFVGEAVRIVVHPKYVRAWPQFSDLAIVFFSGKIPGEFHPIPVLPASLNPTGVQELLLSGFGIDQIGKLFWFKNTSTVDRSQPWIRYNQDRAKGAICNGDSGGPTVLNFMGKPYLVGIHQSVGNADCMGSATDTLISRPDN